ncbi:MAG: PQQ-binding-like beta-propeller repeat protein [Caldisericia bacterium]|nr:PQQ-binding-like beta-propeller repeat protein [Caldisericia bacterium]
MKRISIVAMAALLLVSCGRQAIDTEKTSSWKSPLGTYYGTSMTMTCPEPPLKKLWDVKLPAYSKSSPVIAGGVVIVADESGMLQCIDGNTSQTVWKREMKSTKAMQPVIGANKVYVADGSPAVFCLDINSGDVVWSSDLDSNAVGWPVFGDGRLWVCTAKTLYCFEESKGAQIFAKTYGVEFTQTPTIQMHMFMVAGKKLLAVTPETGEKVWEKDFDREIIAPVCCTRSDIFVVDGRLNKLDGNTGTLLQTYTNDLFYSKSGSGWDRVPNLEQPFTTGAAFYLNMLAIGTKSGEILGFQINDITHYVFYHKINLPLSSAPIVTPKYIWFTAPDLEDTGRFFCIANQLDAKWIWHDWYDEPVSSHPAVTDEAFYVLTDQGRLVKYSTGGQQVNPADDVRKKSDKKQP